MPMLSVRTAVTQRPETDCKTLMRSCLADIGPSHVKELAKFFTPSSDEEDHSRVNTRIRLKRLFESKEKEGRNSEK